MTPPRSFAAFSIVFAVVFAVTYVIAFEKNYALFTYHPALGEFGLWVEKPRGSPAMYWYGWMATSAVVAFIAGLVATWLPESLTKRLWSGLSWTVPAGAMVASAYLLSEFFLK